MGNQPEIWKKLNQLSTKIAASLETNESVNHEAEDDIPDDVVGDVKGGVGLVNQPMTKR